MPNLHKGYAMTTQELREVDACEQCGSPKPKKNKHFCSKTCRFVATWMEKDCVRCGKRFTTRRQYVARGQMKYCSHGCSSLDAREHTTVEHGGDTYHLIHGYYVCSKTGKRLNRVIWEACNGPIPEGLVVHHKDENKINNAISNLQLIEWGEHTSMHNRKRHDNRRSQQP